MNRGRGLSRFLFPRPGRDGDVRRQGESSPEIDKLIWRSSRERCSRDEETELCEWRSSRPANEIYYQELRRLLAESGDPSILGLAPSRPTVDALITRAGADTGRGMVARKSRIPWRIEGNRLFAATGAFALLMLLALVASRHVATGPRSLSLGTGEVVTGVAETVTVTLNDGTVVRLAPSSRLRIGSTPGVREVWLDGRGYFAVTRLPGSRFRVRTHSGDAIVLGTRFDLLARHDDLRLVVVEGAVTVESQGTDVSAGQRQAVQVSPSMPPTLTDLDAEDVSRELDWLGNFIAFENTPLREAAEELTRHYGVTVRVLDEDLGRETVRGVFVDEELENLIPVLCRTVSAHCTISEAGVTIGP